MFPFSMQLQIVYLRKISLNYIFSTCSVLLLWVSSLGVLPEPALLIFICQSHFSPFCLSVGISSIPPLLLPFLTLLSVVTVLSCVSVTLGFISDFFFAFNFFFLFSQFVLEFFFSNFCNIFYCLKSFYLVLKHQFTGSSLWGHFLLACFHCLSLHYDCIIMLLILFFKIMILCEI